MSNFKSLEIIKQETEKKRYYRPLDYARMVALTKFVEGLAQDPFFRIISASPCIAHLRSKSEEEHKNVHETAQFVIGLWVRFEVNDTQFYIQIDANPFFDSYINASLVDHEKKTKKSTGMMNINKKLYKDTDFTNSEENVNKFVENLKEIFSNIQMTHWKSDKYVAHMDEDKQSIYKH